MNSWSVDPHEFPVELSSGHYERLLSLCFIVWLSFFSLMYCIHTSWPTIFIVSSLHCIHNSPCAAVLFNIWYCRRPTIIGIMSMATTLKSPIACHGPQNSLLVHFSKHSWSLCEIKWSHACCLWSYGGPVYARKPGPILFVPVCPGIKHIDQPMN